MARPAYKWLDRRVAAPGPYLTLCLDEFSFLHAMAHCRIRNPPPWIKNPQSHATTHLFTSSKGHMTAIVCMRDWRDRCGVEIAGLLVHEAVHVWQEYIDSIGEEYPGKEQEAYAIQGISQELMAEFARQTKGGACA